MKHGIRHSATRTVRTMGTTMAEMVVAGSESVDVEVKLGAGGPEAAELVVVGGW
jgi:hypothetical protein